MNKKRIIAVTKKEFLHAFRDKRMLVIIFALPVVMLMLYGYALTFDIRNIPTVIMDKDNKPLTRDIIRRFSGSGYFKIVGAAEDFKDEESYLLSGKARMAINFEDGFSSKVLSGEKAPLQVIVDGADANTAVISMGYLNSILQEYSKKLLVKVFASSGLSSADDLIPIDARPRVLYNPELRSMHFLIPGLISFILMILAAMIISLTVVSEKTRGTMEQLISTSITPFELMIGKMVPYIAIGLGDVLLCVIVGVFVFGVHIQGSLLLLFLESLLFLFGSMGLGLAISTTAKRQEDALLMSSMVTFLPSMLLSGFVFPIDSMPRVIQWVTYLVPARYFINILRGIFLKGIGLEYLWPDTLLLSMFAVLMLTISAKRFKKRLE